MGRFFQNKLQSRKAIIPITKRLSAWYCQVSELKGVSTLHQPHYPTTQIAASVNGVIILSIDLNESVLHCINETAYSGKICSKRTCFQFSLKFSSAGLLWFQDLLSFQEQKLWVKKQFLNYFTRWLIHMNFESHFSYLLAFFPLIINLECTFILAFSNNHHTN